MLLALWTVVAGGTITAAGMARARESIATAENRIDLLRASWVAEGCLNQLLQAFDERMAKASAIGIVWDRLDDDPPRLEGCDIAIKPAGLTTNVNQLPREALVEALLRMGVGPSADSLASAIVDWRDADDDPLALGAEREWYAAQGMAQPRNAAFRAREELELVRGASEHARAITLMGVASERVLLSRADEAVIATVPGLPLGAVHFIVAAQRELVYPEFADLATRMPPELRAQFQQALPDLSRLTTTSPEAWLFVVTSTGSNRLTASIEVRVVRDGARLAVVRRRSW